MRVQSGGTCGSQASLGHGGALSVLVAGPAPGSGGMGTAQAEHQSSPRARPVLLRLRQGNWCPRDVPGIRGRSPQAGGDRGGTRPSSVPRLKPRTQSFVLGPGPASAREIRAPRPRVRSGPRVRV